MTHHHKDRHQFASSSLATIATSLLPALGTLVVVSSVHMGKLTMLESSEPAKLPDLPMAMGQLQQAQTDIAVLMGKMAADDGAIELHDFKIDIGRLGDADLITSDSPLISTLETKGHLAAFKQLALMVDNHIGHLSTLLSFKSDDPDMVSQLGSIGADAIATMTNFWAFQAVNVESWLRQNTAHSIMLPPIDHKKTIAA